MTYGQEEQYALDSAQGYGTSGYSSAPGYGGTGYEDQLLGQILTDLNNPTQPTPSTPVPHPSDKSWATQTIDDLVKHGYTRAAATAAIGAYLAGLPLTQHQEDIVSTGLGLNGNPPYSVPAPHVVGSQHSQTPKTSGGGARPTKPPKHSGGGARPTKPPKLNTGGLRTTLGNRFVHGTPRQHPTPKK
jgi:hypothetical protein